LLTNWAAARQDKRWSRALNWEEEFWFVTTTDSSLWEPHLNLFQRKVRIVKNLIDDYVEIVRSFFRHPVDYCFTKLIVYPTLYSLAAEHKIVYDDIDSNIWNRGQWIGENHFNRCRLLDKVGGIYDDAPAQYENFFGVATTFPYKVLAIFAAIQPWCTLTQFSLSTPALIRAHILAAEILGAFAIAALFFSASGIAGDESNDDECAPANDFRAFIRDLIIGFLSSFLSPWPITLWTIIRARGFRYAEHWPEDLIRKRLRVWAWEDAGVLWMGKSYCLFSAFFVACFLANVSPASYGNFLKSVAISMLDNLIITPLKHAVFFALLATLVPVCFSKEGKSVASKLGLVRSDLKDMQDAKIGEQPEESKQSIANDENIDGDVEESKEIDIDTGLEITDHSEPAYLDTSDSDMRDLMQALSAGEERASEIEQLVKQFQASEEEMRLAALDESTDRLEKLGQELGGAWEGWDQPSESNTEKMELGRAREGWDQPSESTEKFITITV